MTMKQLKRYSLPLLSSILLMGCASMGIPSQEFTAEAIETVEANTTVANDYGMSPLELGAMILLAGIAIPDPWRPLGNMFSGIGGFILKMFGR